MSAVLSTWQVNLSREECVRRLCDAEGVGFEFMSGVGPTRQKKVRARRRPTFFVLSARYGAGSFANGFLSEAIISFESVSSESTAVRCEGRLGWSVRVFFYAWFSLLSLASIVIVGALIFGTARPPIGELVLALAVLAVMVAAGAGILKLTNHFAEVAEQPYLVSALRLALDH